MKILLLGPVEVREGDHVHRPAGKQAALLAALALEPGRTIARDRLIDQLWPEDPPETAAKSLDVYVWRLRQAIPALPIEKSGTGYRLAAAWEDVDVGRFDDLVRRGREAAAEDRAPLAAQLLSEALELWRGPALAGLATPAVDHLEERRLAAQEDRIAAQLQSGDAAELVGELEALVEAQPLRERPRELLMLALYRAGRQGDALAAYQQARQQLVDTLGLEPTPALQRLEQAILRQDAELELPQRRRSAPEQEIHFAELAGMRIAAAIVGSGPPLVFVGIWIGHLEALWEIASFRRFVSELARDYTVIRYDLPGVGLSSEQPEGDQLLLETAVLGDAITTFADGHAAVLGVSSGAAVALTLDATRPELVDRLVVYGGYARGADIASPEIQSSLDALVRASWGVGASALAAIVMPESGGVEIEELVRYQRRAASAEKAAELLGRLYSLDASDYVERVTAPTLVLHRRGDRAIPARLGQDLARRIPHATFKSLPGSNHLPWTGDEGVVAAIRTFLGSPAAVS